MPSLRSALITTPRLMMRELGDDDAAEVMALVNEPSFLENIGDRHVRSLEDARRYVQQGPQTSYANHGFGLWAVLRTSDHAWIGMCGLLQRDYLSYPDLGYAYFPTYWGSGFAREAAQGALSYANATLKLATTMALVSPHNHRSLALLYALNFVDVGSLVPPREEHEVRLLQRIALI